MHSKIKYILCLNKGELFPLLYLKKIYEWKKPKGVRALTHRRVMLNNLKEWLATLLFKVHQHQLIEKNTFWQYAWDIPLKTYFLCLSTCMYVVVSFFDQMKLSPRKTTQRIADVLFFKYLFKMASRQLQTSVLMSIH